MEENRKESSKDYQDLKRKSEALQKEVSDALGPPDDHGEVVEASEFKVERS